MMRDIHGYKVRYCLCLFLALPPSRLLPDLIKGQHGHVIDALERQATRHCMTDEGTKVSKAQAVAHDDALGIESRFQPRVSFAVCPLNVLILSYYATPLRGRSEIFYAGPSSIFS